MLDLGFGGFGALGFRVLRTDAFAKRRSGVNARQYSNKVTGLQKRSSTMYSRHSSRRLLKAKLFPACPSTSQCDGRQGYFM